MLSSDTYNSEKLARLWGLARLQLCEVVAIYLPGGTRYFGSAAFDQMPNFRDINHDGTPIQVEPRLIRHDRSFQDIQLSADVSDEDISLSFRDEDGEISELLVDAEGSKVEVFYYLPDLDWFVSFWWGHLQLPDSVDITEFNASAECGIRSSQMSVPRPIFQRPCQNGFGGALETQAQIDAGLCPYNRGVGGATGNLDGGDPFTSCPKTKAACTARLGDTLSYTGVDTSVINITIGQTHGPATQAVSRGNETNLDRSWRRVYGNRIVRDMDLLAMRQEANSGHPDQGYLAALFGGMIGKIQSMTACSIVNMLVGAEHLNTRLGAPRQLPTAYAPNVSNFNGMAHFFGRVGPLNPGGYNAGNVQGQCTVQGAADVRVYSDDDNYTEEYSTNPAWCFLDLYFKPFFGHGVDLSIMVMADWIALARWCNDLVKYTDPFGTFWTALRNTFNADVQGRSAQALFRDICVWHRFVPPFQYLGKLRTFPLRPLTELELAAVPVFYHDGPTRNIIRENHKPQIAWSRKSDKQLANEWQITFEETDASQNISNVERPVTFGDEQQQLRAGRAFGDTTLRAVPQKAQAFGIIYEAEVMRKGNILLDVGELDEGGLKNNFSVRFTTTFQHGFELYTGQVIRIESELIARASAGLQEGGFTYFRVQTKKRNGDLTFEVVAQAYPELYWLDREEIITIGTTGPGTDAYEAEDEANTLTGTAEVKDDANCSGGKKVDGLGADGTLTFNGVVGVGGLHNIVIAYKCTVDRVMRVRINSGPAVLLNCRATGSVPGRVGFNTTLPDSEANTVTIFNPAVAGGGFLLEDAARCPDIDFMYVVQVIEPGGGGPCRSVFGAGVSIVDGRLEVPIDPGGCD